MAFTDPLIGKRLGDYLIESVLGTGGMARVYRGYDDNLDRYAAIKVIEPQLIASAEEDEYRERFLREARAIARLNHNRIVSVYQFNQVGNLYYIAMEYIEGHNLRDVLKGYLKQGRVIPKEELLQVLRDIADALDYAHKQSIIHRDIKPSNIIITPEGNAVLTDFGLALNAVEGTIGNTFGSVHYIAPEQAISSAQAVPASDQYSLGIVAYELLTGRVPFDDASAMSVALKHISDPPPPPTEINPNIPIEVEQVLIKVLDKEPTRRYESSRDFVRNLELAFEMSKAGDIAAPKSIVEAIGAPPVTNPVPPPSRISADDKSKATNQIVIDEDSINKKANTQSQAITSNGQAGWMVAAVLVGMILMIVLYVVFNQFQTNNANATATAQTLAQQETNVAATSVALIAQQTSAAATQIANASATAEALIAQETSNAIATDNQATESAATEAAIMSLSETAQHEATNDAATAEAELVAASETAQHEATLEAATDEAQTEQAQISASETALGAVLSPSTTPTLAVTATSTPSPSPSPSPTLTPSVTAMPSATPTPSLLIASESDTAQVMLRYDGRMFIIANRDALNGIDVSDLVFVQVAPDENGIFSETITFNVGRTELASAAADLDEGRCLEILDSAQFSSLPTQNPLVTGLCEGTPFWVTSVSPFWINEQAQAYFEVRLGAVDVIGRCPVQRPQTRAEQRCSIDLNAIR